MAPRVVRPPAHAGDVGGNVLEVSIGRQIKLRRMLMGLTQAQLATMLGITFQHVHQFERGLHLNASRLYAISKALAVPVEELFSEPDLRLDKPGPGRTMESVSKRSQSGISLKHDGRQEPDILAMIKAFHRIRSSEDRQRLLIWLSDLSRDPSTPAPWLLSSK